MTDEAFQVGAAPESRHSSAWINTLYGDNLQVPRCAFCEGTGVYQMTAKDGTREKDYRWRCRSCERMFTVRTGSVMESSPLPMRFWVHAFWRACASKKGCAALQLARELDINYKCALFMLNRIRLAMKDLTGDGTDQPLGVNGGTVEADET